MEVVAHALPVTLQQARKLRRLSQLELALRLGISQRHVSFVETGRARPSRPLLLVWLAALDAPLVVRNAALLQAGYAPAYGAATLEDPALRQAHDALLHLLHSHDPMPALVIDAHWNLLLANRGARWLAATLMPWTAAAPAGTPLNLFDLLVHPEGFTKSMLNLDETGPAMLAHLREAAAAQPRLRSRVDMFAALLRDRIGTLALNTGQPRPMAPVMTTRFASPRGELAFFSMFTTFGTPQDITLASLQVEHMFAADEATRAILFAEVV